MGNHIGPMGGFQSDKYPTCPEGKVPLSTKDPMAQDLLFEYAERRRKVDEEFTEDLRVCLKIDGFKVEDAHLALARWSIGIAAAQYMKRENTDYVGMMLDVLGQATEIIAEMDESAPTQEQCEEYASAMGELAALAMAQFVMTTLGMPEPDGK